jgi:hypothetical protein
MLIAEARIETDRASRYLVQFCKHAAAMGGGGSHSHRPWAHVGRAALSPGDVKVSAEWSPMHGVVSFSPLGRCTIEATDDALTLHVEATDEAGLRQIQQTIAGDLSRFGRRSRLQVDWQ